jgi:ATP adenylyltransferase
MLPAAPPPCPFCTPPQDRLFLETPVVCALWDGYPVNPGHALVIPRRHFASWFEATDDERSALLASLDAAKTEIDRLYNPDGYNIGVNIGAAAGQTVFHLHIHLIPRFTGDVAEPQGGVRHVIPSRGRYSSS